MEPNGTNEYFTLKSKLQKVEAELNSIAMRKEWGWVQLLQVPEHVTMHNLEMMFGSDLLEMRRLGPHHLIACFSPSSAPKILIFESSSNDPEMSVELLDEREVFNLLSKNDYESP